MGRPATPAIERFWSKVAKAGPNECWQWTGGKFTRGYGGFSYDHGEGQTKPGYAHRFSYIHHHGPLGPDDVVMHTCDNVGCVNPAHLKKGGQGDNIKDAVRKGRWMTYKRQEHLKRVQRDYRRVVDGGGHVKPENRVFIPEEGDGHPLHVFVIGEVRRKPDPR